MIVRTEEKADRAAVHGVEAAAFGRPDEADLVDLLRDDHAAWVPELSLVAVDSEGRVIGHALFTRVTLDGEAGAGAGVALGPVAVAPDRQREGVGGALIREGLARARSLGFRYCVVLGHPEYYPRFGFLPAAPAGLTGDYGEHDAWMAVALGGDRLPRGRVRYPAAFA